MSKPIVRRHLGDFEIRVWNYETRAFDHKKISVFVNAQMLADAMGTKAARSKSKRAKAQFGAVLVEST